MFVVALSYFKDTFLTYFILDHSHDGSAGRNFLRNKYE